MPSRVLGIETTCDETGVAVVEDGVRILSDVVLSQVPLHERFGGVVPEIASRAHVEAITRLVERALHEAGLEGPSRDALRRGARPPVDAVAVAHRPGLIGSLLVGLTAAKSMALAWDLPLVGVDHIHAHVHSAFLRRSPPFVLPPLAGALPAVGLVVSGGHTSLYLAESWTRHRLLGVTLDDAAGEAFDKAAAILELGYPGGPAISRAALNGDPQAFRFPRTLLEPDSLDFSFSGIKTAVLYRVKGQNARRGDAPPPGSGPRIADIAASFEAAVVDVLIEKLRRALRREGCRRAIVGGGVAANRRFREHLEALGSEEGVELRVAEPRLCTDNAAMIAGLGGLLLAEGRTSSLELDASSSGD